MFITDFTEEDGTRVVEYIPQGVCSQMIHIETKNGRIGDVYFVGGCPGNTQGLSVLLKGMEVREAIKRLKGISCGGKDTSCPDQFATALSQL